MPDDFKDVVIDGRCYKQGEAEEENLEFVFTRGAHDEAGTFAVPVNFVVEGDGEDQVAET